MKISQFDSRLSFLQGKFDDLHVFTWCKGPYFDDIPFIAPANTGIIGIVRVGELSTLEVPDCVSIPFILMGKGESIGESAMCISEVRAELSKIKAELGDLDMACWFGDDVPEYGQAEIVALELGDIEVRNNITSPGVLIGKVHLY